ncbi:Rv2578c family radical SAM protein [Microbacterium dextranolyticum]|uniref:Radical SAM protein n=1 Tax=Microbacterium dextranolyticum TaxID=36806 RepID=A0A9W6HLP6_9MICO|nr:Rv2578c family radical SAM protein [Microbacterium dextranolyticum]MBM7464336.1 DNA repair photolyase [Microbacterium dextranolyticum]GLJ95333.1 radical SAM protein [Microbacterium dextranolyticum]
MRWNGQRVDESDAAALPGLETMSGLVRSVTTPDFAGMTFHEVAAKSALNHVPSGSAMPFDWTVNPYRGCSHACSYCFARNTHTYLDLDAGRDFDEQIVVKVNVAEVLRRELAAPGWSREPVALGTNTDPYQRAEGRYRLMPEIIDALASSGTPFSVLTKGTLLRRDLPLLAEAKRVVPVHLAMSIAMPDERVRQTLEAGAPTFSARLETVRAARAVGFAVTVFLMPIVPHLTDGVDVLDDALARIAAAGATRVVYGALHLRPGAREWFWGWLEREHPELVPAYRGLYPGASVYAPAGYRAMLADRVRPLLRRHRLAGGAEEDVENRPPRGARPGPVRATRRAAATATAPAMLF